MDRVCRVLRPRLWWCYLLCALSLTAAGASGVKYPTLPSAQVVGTTGTATSSSGSSLVISKPLTGEYIPGVDGSKTPVRGIHGGIDYSKPRIINHVKAGLRGGLVGLAASAAVGAMLSSIDAFIDENTKLPMKDGKKLTPAGSLFWCHVADNDYCNDSSIWNKKLATPSEYPQLFALQFPKSELCSATYTIQNNGAQVRINFGTDNPGMCGDGPSATSSVTYYRRGTCPEPTYYDSQFMQCVSNEPVPLEDPDYDQMAAFANAQNAAWLQGLLNAACSGSLAPARCYDEMKQNSILNGPSSVQGPVKTSTTTSTNSAGVTTQTTTTSSTTYNIIYGPTYYKYAPVTTTTTTGPDGSETKTDTEPMPADPEDIPPEEEPPQEEQVIPQPCAGSICDGPAYTDQYTPTEQTKEAEIDSYVNRASNIPIIQAVGGLFDVSAGGACPVWTFNHQLEVGGFSTNINLVFDHLCQPWFTQYGPWIRAVIYMVAVYAAIRIALL